jgi:hypothetical protein
MNVAELRKKGDIPTVTYQCAPHVRWAVESRGIILVDQNKGSAHSLSYPQAAVWDLINSGYSFDQGVKMLRAVASMEAKEAERFLLESLDEWAEAGFLITVEDHG